MPTETCPDLFVSAADDRFDRLMGAATLGRPGNSEPDLPFRGFERKTRGSNDVHDWGSRATDPRLWATGAGCLSVQVLQEFVVVATTKLPNPLSTDEAATRVSDWSTWEVFSPTAADVVAAIRLQSEKSLSFWDSMLMISAIELGCSTLWSEDLNHGELIRGVRVQNPFADSDG